MYFFLKRNKSTPPNLNFLWYECGKPRPTKLVQKGFVPHFYSRRFSSSVQLKHFIIKYTICPVNSLTSLLNSLRH